MKAPAFNPTPFQRIILTAFFIVCAGSSLAIARAQAPILREYLAQRHTIIVDLAHQQPHASLSLTTTNSRPQVGDQVKLTLSADVNGAAVQAVSARILFPASLLSVGQVSSNNPGCQSSLQIVQGPGHAYLQCQVQSATTTSQATDLFTLSFLAKAAGSAIVQTDKTGSTVTVGANTLTPATQDAVLSILP